MSSAMSKTSLRVLLDQHDRQALVLELADGAPSTSATICGARPFGRLVHQQHARIVHQRAADRQHLLLAAGQRLRRSGCAAPSGAETCANTVSTRPRRVPAAGSRLARGDDQVLAHRQAAEDAAALRHQRDAARGDLLRRQPRDRRRRTPRPLPRRGGSRPTVTFMQVDLPAPLRPSRPSSAALAERERDLLQHMAVAVEGVDVGRG